MNNLRKKGGGGEGGVQSADPPDGHFNQCGGGCKTRCRSAPSPSEAVVRPEPASASCSIRRSCEDIGGNRYGLPVRRTCSMATIADCSRLRSRLALNPPASNRIRS